jgi:choline dehydrogenase-like flavoprotein
MSSNLSEWIVASTCLVSERIFRIISRFTYSTRRPRASRCTSINIFPGCRPLARSGFFKARASVLEITCMRALLSDQGALNAISDPKKTLKFLKKKSHFEQKIFRADPEINHPDIQFHFLPSQVIDHGRTAPQEEAFQVHVGTLRAKSVGNLKLKSNNPRDHPVIDPRFAEIVRKFLLF